jgi:serine phosphatase RsbU (regulator of sigma subunit)
MVIVADFLRLAGATLFCTIMPFASLTLFQSAVGLSRSQLRWELLVAAVGVTLISLGVAAVAAALYFARRNNRDRTLIYFGMFSALYGLRLVGGLQVIQSLFTFPPVFWPSYDWFITCIIMLPLGFFILSVVGPRLRRVFRWLIAAQIIFDICAIVAAISGVRLKSLYFANNMQVLATLVGAAICVLIVRRAAGPQLEPLARESKIAIFGFLVWMAFVVQINVASLRTIGAPNYEFIGFAIFVSCLGYVAVSRSFAREEQLLSINKELQIARQIQASILPRDVPHLAGLEIAARYAPMSAVAGDFYDFLPVDSARVGILVADVSGHGVPAALIASMLKVAFAGQAEHAADPARVLAGLNRALCGKFEEHFVTAGYLFVDIENKVARYAGAGHPPLLLAQMAPTAVSVGAAVGETAEKGIRERAGTRGDVRDDERGFEPGNVREIEENGFMLGVFPDAEFTAAEIPLRAGDRCLLYTDGLFEAANTAQEEYGRTRVAQFLETRRDQPAPQFADALLAEIAQWAGHAAGGQADDITLVVIDLAP